MCMQGGHVMAWRLLYIFPLVITHEPHPKPKKTQTAPRGITDACEDPQQSISTLGHNAIPLTTHRGHGKTKVLHSLMSPPPDLT